jgi:hypothetical protein
MRSQPVPIQEPGELELVIEEGDPPMVIAVLQKRLAGGEPRSFLGMAPIWGRRGPIGRKRESEEKKRDEARETQDSVK